MSRGGGGDILFGFGCFCGVVLLGVVDMCLWGLFVDIANLPATPPADLPVSDPYLLRALGGGVSPEVSVETLRQEEVLLKRVTTLGIVAVAVRPFLSWAVNVTTCSLVCSLIASRSMLVFKHVPARWRPQIFVKPFPYRWQKDVIYVVGLLYAWGCLECLVPVFDSAYGEGAGAAVVSAALLLQGLVLCKVGGASIRTAALCAFLYILMVGAIFAICWCLHTIGL